jgi:tRNA (guanine-N7-)-methyltransferase
MGHKKLIRFAEVDGFANVVQLDTKYKGKWQTFFEKPQPLVLELACGKGEYTVGLATAYPENNYLGIDIKGNRIWSGAKKALQLNLRNAGFLRTQIDSIAEYFDTDEVHEIWITFPDPQLRWSKMNKRLTHPKFLRLYKKFLQKGGTVHLKTDSPDLYNFTQKVIEIHQLLVRQNIVDVHKTNHNLEVLNIKTHYEGLNISGSNKIFYIAFTIDNVNEEGDDTLKKYFAPKEI